MAHVHLVFRAPWAFMLCCTVQVATHILPEISAPPVAAASSEPCAEVGAASGAPNYRQNIALVAGIVLPLFISIEHSH